MNIAIIPARAGSKSIINKNLQKIGNMNLFQWTLQSAVSAKIFDKIVITTDIPTLINDLKDVKQLIVRERPLHLCEDNSLMTDVVEDVNELFKDEKECLYWILQPTAPFRSYEDYRQIQGMFKGTTRSVISVTAVNQYHPNRMYTCKESILYPLRFTGFANKQDLPQVYIRSGHFYVFYKSDFEKQKSFYLKPCRPYFIDKVRAWNIDDKFDLFFAQSLYKEGWCP